MAKHPPRREHTTNLKDQLGGLKFERTVPGDKRLALRSRWGVAGANPQMVFFSSVYTLCELPLDKLKRATLPDPSWLTFPQDQRGQSVSLSLICDNVQEPGHHPATMSCSPRVCHDDKLGMGCVDAWEPKVLRAVIGAHFLHVADNCSGYEREIAENMEANQSNKPSKAGDFGWMSSRPNCKDMHYEEYQIPRAATKLYHEGWAQGNTGHVIGGETHGLSLEAVQLVERTAGPRLFIPVVPGVDGLNSASMLLFEGSNTVKYIFSME
uniref:tRNA/rRNA methyltransferase SpoU type domain-containing protein n=1 Tax=Oncorhynchus tshawytscha TaxID=74940 RepID=A0A8C8EI24_ONCTS